MYTHLFSDLLVLHRVFLLLFLQSLGSLAFQCFHQRVLSASSARSAQIGCFGAAVLVSILAIPPVLIGAVAVSTGKPDS